MAGPVDIIIGPPGAGKTEQADRLEVSRRYVHFSTGALLRTLGDQEVKAEMAAGQLVPSQAVEALLTTRLEGLSSDLPILLDGFPRTEAEASWLDEQVAKLGRGIEHVILLNLDPKLAAERLAQRGRPDDQPEQIKRRQADFEHQAKPVIRHYRHLGRLIEIDGAGSPQEVEARILGAL